MDVFNPFEELKRDLQRGRRWVRLLPRVLTFVFEQMSLCFEAVMRRGFGEQYLSYGVVVRLTLVLLLFLLIASYRRFDLPFFLFALISVGSLVAARLEIEERKRRGEQWHSLDNGIPLFTRFFGMNELRVKQWLEPCVVLLLGFLFFLVASPFSLVLLATALYMWVKEFQIQRQLKQHYLNAINARILGQHTQQLNKVGWQQYFRNRQQQFYQPRTPKTAQGQSPQKPRAAKLTGMNRPKKP